MAGIERSLRHLLDDLFSTPLWRDVQSGIIVSKYPADGLRKALTSTFGPLKLQDLKAHTVLVPAFDLDSTVTLTAR